MKKRFSGDLAHIAELHQVLRNKPEKPDFAHASRIFNLQQQELQYEWHILRRSTGDLSSTCNILDIACSPDKQILFPTFSRLARSILLLPIGTATVERSFSAMNRILKSERCRLLPQHVNALMQISIEGPKLPDVRDSAESDELSFTTFIDKVYKCWRRKSHHV